jgi:tRNA U34 5-methylaminomethyl-2-thiouridine-forming methyltransferase MnmC
LENFEIVELKSGLRSLRCLKRRETFHPVTGPWIEANLLHVEQQRLVERASRLEKLVIWDVGFGAAANALAAITALKDAPISGQVELHSFDRTTAPAEFAVSHSGELEYLGANAEVVGALLRERAVRIGPRLSWQLHLGDFREQLEDAAVPAPHAILYDPYSPATNPDMWSLEHFTRLRARLSADAPCLLTNYTRSTSVRTTLLLAGFAVGVGDGVGEKDQTTVASNDPALIERPLGREFLERVKVSYSSAPFRGESYRQLRIGPEDLERLGNLPQFSP